MIPCNTFLSNTLDVKFIQHIKLDSNMSQYTIELVIYIWLTGAIGQIFDITQIRRFIARWKDNLKLNQFYVRTMP